MAWACMRKGCTAVLGARQCTPYLRHGVGSRNNCCSRPHTHAQAAAQELSIQDQPWHSTLNAEQGWDGRNEGCQLHLAPPVVSSHEHPSCIKQACVHMAHTSEPGLQQKQHTEKHDTQLLVSVGSLTKLLVAASVVPALLLAVQPLVCCGELGIDASAAALPWQGPLRDMFSFTVLLSVFITCEPGAAVASAVSATGAALQLLSGPVPPPLVACCTAAALAASASTVLLAAASIQTSSDGSSCSTDARWQSAAALQTVQQALGVLGGGLLVHYLATLLPVVSVPARTSGFAWLLLVAIGGLAMVWAGRHIAVSKDKQVLQVWADWPAWSATLLLVFQPLQQLVESSLQPLHLMHSFSARQQLLLVLASGLMVPRALLQRELMWFTGTFCGASLAAGQLAVWATLLWSKQWATMEHITNLLGRAAPAVVVMGVVLLVVCGLLKAGWQYIRMSSSQRQY